MTGVTGQVGISTQIRAVSVFDAIPRSVSNEGRLVALRTERLFSAHGY